MDYEYSLQFDDTVTHLTIEVNNWCYKHEEMERPWEVHLKAKTRSEASPGSIWSDGEFCW